MNSHPIQLTIDGREVTVDALLTILEAARQNGIDIPTLCHHPALSSWGGCRLCVVEVDESPRLAASCVMPVRHGMEVVTVNDAITASRRMTLELLFSERNHNCMFCPDSGNCELQKMAYALQMDHLTVSQSFLAFPVDVTGEYMTLDHNRCILCGRCVRACQEIAGTYILGFHHRGPQTIIGFDLLEKRDASGCTNCGACLQVCPTGAISSRYRAHYLVKGQSAEHETIASTCAGCSLLCPTQAIVRDNQLLRIEGVLAQTSDRPDRGQLCYKGRFEVLKTGGQRLLAPMIKDPQGRWQEQGWGQTLDRISDGFRTLPDGRLFGIASSCLANEALVLFKDMMVTQWKARMDTLDGDHFRRLAALVSDTGATLPGEVSWNEIAGADMVLVVGTDLHDSHPLLRSLLRQAYIERGISIAVIGRTVGADLFSTACLPVEEWELAPLLIALAAMAESADKAAQANAIADEAQLVVLKDIAQAYGAAGTPLVLAGEQLTGATDGNGLEALFKLAHLKKAPTGQRDPVVILKPGTNSLAAWGLGLAGLQAVGVSNGGGMVLLGDEHHEALQAWAKGLQNPGFLVVMSPYFHPALAEIAHVLLPRPLGLEEDGSYASLNGTPTVFKPKVLDPPPGVRFTWETLQDLAQRAPSPAAPETWMEIRTKVGQRIHSLNR